MHLTHRATVTLGIVGLVVAGLLTSGSGGIPATRQNASQTPQNRLGAIPASFPAPSAWPVVLTDDQQAAQDVLNAALAALTAQEAQDLADRLAAAVQRSLAAVPAPAPRSSDFATFRECTIAIESHGQYDINTGNGYYGAWQFDQRTWDGAVTRAGYPEWSGRPASEAPPGIQDAAAAQLYSERGNQPWGGRC